MKIWHRVPAGLFVAFVVVAGAASAKPMQGKEPVTRTTCAYGGGGRVNLGFKYSENPGTANEEICTCVAGDPAPRFACVKRALTECFDAKWYRDGEGRPCGPTHRAKCTGGKGFGECKDVSCETKTQPGHVEVGGCVPGGVGLSDEALETVRATAKKFCAGFGLGVQSINQEAKTSIKKCPVGNRPCSYLCSVPYTCGGCLTPP